jgi:dCMP deaminase
MVALAKWDQRFLSLAEYVAAWSKDPSTRVGAVIASGNRIVSLGYNGFPVGVNDDPSRYESREEKYPRIVHAEMNAILFAHRDLSACTLYTWPFMPCPRCAGPVIQTAIKRVVTLKSDNPRWQADFDISRGMFAEAGVALIEA